MTAYTMSEKKLWVTVAKVWKELEDSTGQSLTNEEVSQNTGVHRNTIGSYRNGTVQRPHMEVLFKLRDFFADRLNRTISLEELVRWENKTEETTK